MSLLANIIAEVNKKKQNYQNITFNNLVYGYEYPAIITDLQEQGKKIIIEFTVFLSNEKIIKQKESFSGTFGENRLCMFMSMVDVENINNLLGKACFIMKVMNGDFTNIEISQFVDMTDFKETVENL